MAVSPYVINDINTYLFTDQDYWWSGFFAASYGCEVAMQADNINGQMTRYVQPISRWGTHNPRSTDDGGSYARPIGQWNGSGDARFQIRPSGGYYVRNSAWVNETSRQGYVASFNGGFINDNTICDALTTVDYEPCYGHRNAMPHSNSIATQFRDSEPNNLPLDGSSVISLAGSAYNRSKQLLPSYLIAHITDGGTVGSGGVKFMLEERPTFNMSRSTTYPIRAGSYEIAIQTGQADLCLRSFIIHLGRTMDMWWVDGRTQVLGHGYLDGTYAGVNMDLNDPRIVSRHPVLRSYSEGRIRQAAYFTINSEYFGYVNNTTLSIHSSKMGIYPILFVDLAKLWTTATRPRIAGVACAPGATNNKVYILAESGEIAVYDFAVKNGALSLLAPMSSNGVSLPSESACAALAYSGGKLYALLGNMSSTPMAVSEQTPTVGVCEYDPGSNTWGTVSYSPLNGRVNGRSLNEMIALRDGKLVAVVEKTKQVTARPDVFRVETGWTGVSQTWGGVGQNKTLIFRLQGGSVTNNRLPKFKIRFHRTTTGSYNITSAKLAVVKHNKDGVCRVQGSVGDPVPGITFDQTVPITFNNGATVALVNSVSELDTDFINVPMDLEATDYYVIVGISGTSFGVPYTDNSEAGRTKSIFSQSDIASVTSTVDLGSANNRCHFISKVFNDEVGAFFVNDLTVSTGAFNYGTWKYQVVVYDPVAQVWNTNAIDNGITGVTNSNGYWGWHLCHTTLIEAQPNVVILQAHWDNQKVYAIDTNQPLATINGTNVLAIGQGTPDSIFPSWFSAGQPLFMMKNVIDDRVICGHPGNFMQYYANRVEFFLANPGFNWKGGATTKLTHIYADDGDRDGGAVNFRKNMLMCGDNAGEDNYTTNNWLSLPLFFAGNAFAGFHHDSGSWAWANNIGEGQAQVYWVPTYYKWATDKWVIADSFEDAHANGRPVPALPGTQLDLLWGLKGSFGPSAGTTFNTGEWHTINATYGFVKFARKARYTFAFFTGKTFNMTESRSCSDYNDLQMRYYSRHQGLKITASGPDTITYDATGNAVFPRLKGDGTMNTGPVAVTYEPLVTYPQGMVIDGVTAPVGGTTVAAAPDWNSLINVPQNADTMTFPDGTTQVTSASGYYDGNYMAWRAFSNKTYADLRWQSNTNGGTPWLQIKLRGEAANPNGRKVRAYSFCDPNLTLKGWVLEGSANGTTWTTLHTVTRPAPSYVGNVYTINDPGVPYLYYRLRVTSSTGWLSITSFFLYEQPLKDTFEITDILTHGAWAAQGHKFEADTGTGFFEVSPLWIASHRQYYCFDRLTGVKKFRVTVQTPCNNTGNAAQAWFGDYVFWDYNIPTTHVTRLGTSAAPVNTPEKGTYDPECLGIAPDVTTIWVDNNSPSILGGPRNQDQSGEWGAVTGWWFGTDLVGPTYKIHPFFGFMRFGRPTGVNGPDGGGTGSPAYAPAGTTLNINYCWGRRV